MESKTPVAQIYSYSPDKSMSKSSSPLPSVQKVPPPSKESTVENLAAPFGDPLTQWTTRKQNLLLFGPSNYDKNRGVFEHEVDAQSVSTVSGSGMDFFRKFVQRKGPRVEAQQDTPTSENECKECEDQFRREVLIDRLVADALNSQQSKQSSSDGSSRTKSDSESSVESIKFVAAKHQEEFIARALESSCSSGKCPAHSGTALGPEDTKSIRSSVSESTVLAVASFSSEIT